MIIQKKLNRRNAITAFLKTSLGAGFILKCRTEILPIVKWVGDRKQIFNIHLRNIRGGWNNFQEVYPDNGNMDLGDRQGTTRCQL